MSAGHASDLVWTYTTDDAIEGNFGRWHLARCAIHADGTTREAAIDQTAVDGWQSLGELDFAAGADQWIHLGDNTGEPLADRVQLGFDAVRVTHVGAPRAEAPPGTDEPTPGVEDPALGDDAAGGCSASGAALSCSSRS